MKIFTKYIVVAVCGLMLAATPKASALLVAFEYTFVADPGEPTWFDGSTIILRPSFYNQGIDLLGWNLVNSGVPGFEPLTINNSTVITQSFTDDSSTTWDGSFSIANASATFDGQNDAGVGFLNTVEVDPQGKWVQSADVDMPVPDAASSAGMLISAIGALGVVRRVVKQKS